jgi:hypothetical protein
LRGPACRERNCLEKTAAAMDIRFFHALMISPK